MYEYNTKDLKIVSVIFAVLAILFFIGLMINEPTTDDEAVFHSTSVTANDFTGNSLYAYDTTTDEVLFAQNENEILPLASITKLMTAYVALKSLPQDTIVTISSSAISMTDDHGLLVDEKWLLEDIAKFTLLVSSNDGARAIREKFESTLPNSFVASMNAYAKILGMNNTTFYNESGLDEGLLAGSYGTASDVAILLEAFSNEYPQILATTAMKNVSLTSLSGVTHNIENTNESIYTYPGRLGSKTGLTNIAGGNLAFIFDRGVLSPTIVVVLGSTKEGRFEDMHVLINAILGVK